MIRYYGPRRRHSGGRELPHWYARTYDTETKQRGWKSLKTTTLSKARKEIARLEREAENPEAAQAKARRLDELLDLWLGEIEPTVSTVTAQNLRKRLRWWKRAFGARLSSAFDRDYCRDYLLAFAAGRAPSTANLERRSLCWFGSWAEDRGYLRENPAAKVRAFRTAKRLPRTLTTAERERLLAELERGEEPDWFALAVILALETGLRRRTVRSIRWEHIDLETGWIRIPAGLMKAHRDYEAPLSKPAIAALKRYRTSVAGPVLRCNNTALSNAWLRTRERLGMTDVRWHDLRKTCVTAMIERGVDVAVVAAISDHRDIRTLMEIYYRVKPAALLKAVGRDPASGEEGASTSGA